MRGRYWSVKIDDISCDPLPETHPPPPKIVHNFTIVAIFLSFSYGQSNFISAVPHSPRVTQTWLKIEVSRGRFAIFTKWRPFLEQLTRLLTCMFYFFPLLLGILPSASTESVS